HGTGGVAADLARLLEQYGVQNVQTHSTQIECAAGTPAGQGYAEDLRLAFRTVVPFIQKWSRLPDNYEELYREMVHDMQQPGFVASLGVLTAWGNKPPRTPERES
ncbi:MAG TPA: hypothetical protein VKU38_06680, partial [Ktedonobacteraceae bacterium]|nr:hypothetical protein [Ktedonobacteraceae bacterium]